MIGASINPIRFIDNLVIRNVDLLNSIPSQSGNKIKITPGIMPVNSEIKKIFYH